MKQPVLDKHLVPTAVMAVLAICACVLPLPLTAAQDEQKFVGASIRTEQIFALPIQTDPSTSLSRGRALLKQGHADQALPLLESALSGFTSSNNARGIAAAQDALGDLYMIPGAIQRLRSIIIKRHINRSFVASGKDQTSANVANNVASRAGSTASAATETAATASLDNGFNANLMLAKIGDTNYRMGQMSEASTAYFQMNVRKPESAAAKTTRRLGGLGGIGGILTTGKPSIEAPVTSGIGLLETTKEIEEYRKSIVYMTFELGIGRVAFANKDLEAARKHFQNALDAGSGALPVVAKMGQTRRFKAAARTSLGDVALREGRYKDAVKMFNDAADGAKKDERLDPDVAGAAWSWPQSLVAGGAG
jgi:tetratricopeptide (TPR) repeat protein